jgi:CopA family copper-resistance protein
MTRSDLLRMVGALGAIAAIPGITPAYARDGISPLAPTANGERAFDFIIDASPFSIDGRSGRAITINGSIPAPLLRAREGETVVVRVTNRLKESTSIHWHGLLIPNDMDGVPGVTFGGIGAGKTFTYRLPIKQNGSYWFHSHTGLQEQVGVYGPIILDPSDRDPVAYDREHVLMLSDWTFDNPMTLIEKLRKDAGYFNFSKLKAADYMKMARAEGHVPSLFDRSEWAHMRMDPTDLADISAYTYTYLLNGLSPQANWTSFFKLGERVRLRVIGGAAMSTFDIRIPGLPMTVVQADGQNIKPVIVDEFRVAPGETYDVIVHPTEDRAYTIFAESMDRSGYARGTLAPRSGMSTVIPTRRARPLLSMRDMGMDMSNMSMSGMNMSGDMKNMQMARPSLSAYLPGSPPVTHGSDTHGIENTMVPMQETNRLAEPGTGLENAGHRVLVYTDLQSLAPQADQRTPMKTIELHLTGNMERFMWSFDGKKYSEAGALQFRRGERVRMILVNDTMMEHPIHLHGMYMELENGTGANQPFKHTIRVKPAERLSLAITPELMGDWALHCHLLLHMEMGMMRVVQVIA